MFPKRSRNALLIASAVALVTIIAGCAKNEDIIPIDRFPPPTSPDQVLKNLQTSYKLKDIDQYAKLLAEDFHFFFDAATSEKINAPNWNRFDDSTGTALSIFKSDEIGTVDIKLTYNPTAEPVNELGREHWKKITADAWLEVDQKPSGTHPEGVTLRVDHQQHLFYFRLGFTEADTLPESKTKDLYHITEWWDQGTLTGT